MNATSQVTAPEPCLATPVQAIVSAFLANSDAGDRYVPEALTDRQLTLKDFAAYMGDTALSNCTPDHVFNWVVSHARWKTASTRKLKAQQVQTCFNWAVKVRKIASNPFAGISFAEGSPRRAMKEVEFRALLRCVEPGMRRFLLFLWLTGCRVGEARQIVWDEISWQDGVIVKERHKTRKKTGKPRVIVLVPTILAMLAWMRRQRPQATGEVFRNGQGRAWRKETIDDKIRRLRMRIGLAHDVVLHGIRHAFGTRKVKAGGNIKMVSLAMGHGSVATTERYYLHLDREADMIRAEISGSPGW